MLRRLFLSAALLALSGSPDSSAEALPAVDALLYVLRTVDPEIREAAIFMRIDAGESELLLAGRKPETDDRELLPGQFWWPTASNLTLVRKVRASGELELLTTVRHEPRGGDVVLVRRATWSEILLARYHYDGSAAAYLKFFIDLSTRTVRTATFGPFSIQKVQLRAGVPIFIAGDRKKFVVIRAISNAPFLEVLSGPEAASIVSSLPVEEGTVGGEIVRTIEESPQVVRFGPSDSFRWDPKDPGKVTETTARGDKAFSIPQSTHEEWIRARPYAADLTEVRATSPPDAGFSCVSCEPDESIGSPQVVGSRLWFGKAFIDGEGSTGVGGIGYFDATTRKFTMMPIPEMRNHSVSALFVEDEVMWVGLVYNSSCSADESGGVLRIDLGTRRARWMELPAIIATIVRYDDRLYLATSDGVAIVDPEGKPEPFFIDVERDGSHQLVGALNE
jgi:hypothetical protein